MKNAIRLLAAGSLILLGMALPACTTTFTESELQAREARDDAQAQAEEERDRRTGQEGGVAGEEVEEESTWVDHEAEL